MHNRMNDEARPEDWKVGVAEFLLTILNVHGSDGYVFLGTKDANNGKWGEHPLSLPIERNMLMEFFRSYDRGDFDLYFCPNTFQTDERKTVNARKTHYACVDVDDAPLSVFDRAPTISWETSPGRTQAIWVYDQPLRVQHAEQIARNLAYDYGADRNGWSVTKYLRVPFTYNHKPAYDRPEVRLLQGCADPLEFAYEPPPYAPAPVKISRQVKSKSSRRGRRKMVRLPQGRKHQMQVLKKYSSQLKLMPRALLGHHRMLFPDRSDAIYAMVAGLYNAGAARDEIDVAIWNSVYFIDKYGKDRCALETEVTRILYKLEARK